MYKVLVRVAPEINIKTPKIKARFLKSLVFNIEDCLNSAGIQHKIDERWSRILVEMDSTEGYSHLTRVFGIGSISPIEHEWESDLSKIKPQLVDAYKDLVEDKTFCVRVKRSGVKGFTSHQAERDLGGALGVYARKVSLKDPDVKVELEITTHSTLVFTQRIPGAGGLPLGSQGKALCLMSGGFDSPVAAWRMMKRGVSLDYVFCNLAGSSYERSVLSVVKGLCEQWSYGTSPKIYVVDFKPVAEAIEEHIEPRFAQVVLKRQFYRAAGAIANRIKAHGLVTGEAIGQVSSQTLANLASIDVAVNEVVLRPLISFDKEEILKIARDIGTYVLSEHIQEYCSLNNNKPVTGTNPATLDQHEAQLPEGLIARVLESTTIYKVKKLTESDLMRQLLFTTSIDAETVVIDTRDKKQFDAWHHPDALYLPLQNLSVSFSHFDRSKRYVLVCQFGLQTAVIAELMQKQGFEAYSYSGGARSLKKANA